jgi:hypothetical protein
MKAKKYLLPIASPAMLLSPTDGHAKPGIGVGGGMSTANMEMTYPWP